jgi:hypothetical protein
MAFFHEFNDMYESTQVGTVNLQSITSLFVNHCLPCLCSVPFLSNTHSSFLPYFALPQVPIRHFEKCLDVIETSPHLRRVLEIVLVGIVTQAYPVDVDR